MINGTQVRYWIGKSGDCVLDTAVASKLVPTRFPVGWHLEFDLQRFLGPAVNVIVDGGANVGNTALRFARFFNEATIHAFEPIGATFNRLEESIRNCPRIVCKQLALGETEAELSITLSGDSELNSLVNQTVSSCNSERVRVISLNQYAQSCGLETIDVLKLDLEGYELHALRGADLLLNQRSIRAVYAECGFDKTDPCKTAFGASHEFLTGNDFRFSGLYQTFRWGSNKRWAGFSNGLWLHH